MASKNSQDQKSKPISSPADAGRTRPQLSSEEARAQIEALTEKTARLFGFVQVPDKPGWWMPPSATPST